MDRLKNIYEDPSNPGSFGGVDSLYAEARKQGVLTSKNDVREWLKKRLSYTLHKPARKIFKRNKVTVFYKDEQWQMDLCDMSKLKEYNDGVTFLLTVIDLFSKYAFAKPLADKRGLTVLSAFLEILEESGRKCDKLQSDMGVEFTNKSFRSAMIRLDIKYYVTYSEVKASVIERWNRTLKTRMWKYFTHANSFRYLDILPDLVKAYNSSPHHGISGRTPVSVTDDDTLKIWRENYAVKHRKIKLKFKVGDKVRISRAKGVFEKGYVNNWSEEYFVVEEALHRKPPVYQLKDLNNQTLKGTFYEQQLQAVTPGDVYPISQVIRRRGNRALVSWRGWPSPYFDSWIPLADIEKI